MTKFMNIYSNKNAAMPLGLVSMKELNTVVLQYSSRLRSMRTKRAKLNYAGKAYVQTDKRYKSTRLEVVLTNQELKRFANRLR